MDLRGRILAAAFLICGVLCSLASAQQVTRDDEWVFNTSRGVPVWIAFNDLIRAPSGDRREMFIFIEPQHFTPENIQRLFSSLAAEYKKPDWLDVTAFSDKIMLQRAINLNFSGICIYWADTTAGQAAAKKWAEVHEPLPSGYSRAYYFRIGRRNYSQDYLEENYSYSPDPEKPEMVTVVLQDKPAGPPYSGDLNSDLLIAAEEGDEEKVRALIRKGANVNSRDEDGDTALMVAALRGLDSGTVNSLLANRANVNAKNKENDTALIFAASNDDSEILEALLNKGAHINHQNDNGYTALIMASVDNRRLANARVLVARGADLNLKSDRGETALVTAAGGGVVELVHLLLEKGARVDARDKNGDTALFKTAKPEVIRLLLENGADVNARNNNGVTPLMQSRTNETARLLLDRGADVNAKTNDGETPLMFAVRLWGTDTERARFLLEMGANVSAKNVRGETALSLANRRHASNAMLDLLEAEEAKKSESFASVSDSKSLKSGDLSKPQLVVKRDPLAQCCEEVVSVAFSPDSKVVASKLYRPSFDGNRDVILWDATTGKLVSALEGPGEGVIAIRFTPDGRQVASEYASTWNTKDGKPTTRSSDLNDPPSGHSVYASAWSPDGTVYAVAERKIGERNKLTIRNASTGELLRSFQTETAIRDLRFSGDGKTLAGVTRNPNAILIWDMYTGDVIQKISVVGPAFDDLSYNRDGTMLAASAGEIVKNDRVDVFDPGTGKVIYSLNGQSSVVFSLTFSPDNKIRATGSGDTTVKLWDAATGKLLRTMEGHTQLVRSVAFSPDGRLLASGGGKNETKIWSVTTGKLLVTLAAFNDGNWIAYTPDGYYDRSDGASKYVSWRIGKNVRGETEYGSEYFKPDVVAARLRN
jgi:WD40 repeat protein